MLHQKKQRARCKNSCPDGSQVFAYRLKADTPEKFRTRAENVDVNLGLFRRHLPRTDWRHFVCARMGISTMGFLEDCLALAAGGGILAWSGSHLTFGCSVLFDPFCAFGSFGKRKAKGQAMGWRCMKYSHIFCFCLSSHLVHFACHPSAGVLPKLQGKWGPDWARWLKSQRCRGGDQPVTNPGRSLPAIKYWLRQVGWLWHGGGQI